MAIEFTITKKSGDEFKCIIDDCDADLLENGWWTSPAGHGSKGMYVRRKVKQNGKLKPVLMHRIIMARILGRELLSSEIIDHADRNGLNNTRANLRIATPGQNQANAARRRGELGVKGVHRRNSRYQAVINIGGKTRHLGMFDTIEEARFARAAAERDLYGEFACDD